MSDSATRRRYAVGGAAFLAYGWWLTAREPFSQSALIAVLAAVVALVAVAEVHRHRSAPDPHDATTRRSPFYGRAIVIWSSAVAALVAWELLALRSSPRSEHPTISSFVESVEHHHLARLALYAVWIWFGWELAK